MSPSSNSTNPQHTGRRSIPWTSVRIDDPFWSPRRATLVNHTLQSQWQQLLDSGRLAPLGIWDGDGPPPPTHCFYDSDIVKWLEAVAYAQAWHPDKQLKQHAMRVIAGYESIQEDDGYCNQSFIDKPDQRWTNLCDLHELYCAGHLFEAAVAWHDALGEDRLLTVATRLAEHIWDRFGPDGEPGIPGHPEIELALERLARATNEPRWRMLAKLFIDRRGQQPQYFKVEAKRRGGNPSRFSENSYLYHQAQVPVREADTIDGHAVRALYLLAGMVDLAADDPTLEQPARAWWNNAVKKRMYITGGFGSNKAGEDFTHDYDLPNREAYAETCAGIAGALVARRWLTQKPNARDRDILERCLHNAMLAGLAIDGDHYYYANPLTAQLGIDPHKKNFRKKDQPHLERKAWYGCACCPPNVARILASLGSYIADVDDAGLDIHLPIGCTIDHGLWRIVITGDYVSTGKVIINIEKAPDGHSELRLGLPTWRTKAEVKINDQSGSANEVDGYAVLDHQWGHGDTVTCDFGIAPRRCFANPRIADDAHRAAIQRGPLIYCLEQCDHDADLSALRLPDDATLTEQSLELPGGIVVSVVEAQGEVMTCDSLYTYDPPKSRPHVLRFVPFPLWGNRKVKGMQVWVARS